MPKEVVISTSGLNSYGSRVMTAGLDTSQYCRNPVLLWMHRRGGDNMPIGRMENLRVDGDRLIGTPKFDEKDEFAKKIATKWEDGYLNMCSAGIEILEYSTDPSMLVQGQTRATATASKLVEVSIVDIGANDEALKLYGGGKLLELAAGQDCDLLPLVKLSKPEETPRPEAAAQSNENTNSKNMKKETFLLLGLAETATEEQVHAAVTALKSKADNAETLTLAAITAQVDAAITERRITADRKEFFINLGKTSGVDALRQTLELMQPARKPTDVIDTTKDAPQGQPEQATFAKLSEVPADKVSKLRKDNPNEYMRLYKAEYGIDCPKLED
jgi:hypothetical protein